MKRTGGSMPEEKTPVIQDLISDMQISVKWDRTFRALKVISMIDGCRLLIKENPNGGGFIITTANGQIALIAQGGSPAIKIEKPRDDAGED